MNCPHCNTAVILPRGRCSTCGWSLWTDVQLAAGLTTPPHVVPESDDDAVTFVGGVDAATIIGTHESRVVGAAGDEAVTRIHV